MASRRSFWGWGYEGEGLSQESRERLRDRLASQLGVELELAAPPSIKDVHLRAPRIEPPRSLADVIAVGKYERAAHSYGKSYRDVLRGSRGDYPNPTDLVALPRSEHEVADIMEWCDEAQAAVIPYGGGSSVVGGVEPAVGDAYRGVVTLDLARLDRVLEVDRLSRAARVQAGVYGPALEDQLRPHGLTLRHYPQSFEFSTLGGWIATRSGGHFATLHTHIDDFVESLRMLTPSGVLETRRLPGSGAGPSPDRLAIGSEGILGVITEAWVRLQDRPRFRTSAAVRFGDFADGVTAARSLAQSGLYPSNCRLLDQTEALTSGAGDGTCAILVVGFESAQHPVDAWMSKAVELCGDCGGEASPRGSSQGGEDAARAWRRSFLQAPYLRDALVLMGLICETFETAITWERFESLHSAVVAAARSALGEVGSASGLIACRLTHVYPDGAAPYYTVLAPGRHGAQLEQWDTVKQAVSDAVLSTGGTITHHHAVGRDHRPWYDRQRPDLFAAALAAAKREMDPAGLMNPGVLVG